MHIGTGPISVSALMFFVCFYVAFDAYLRCTIFLLLCSCFYGLNLL